MLNVVMLNIDILSVVRLGVVMLSVVAPFSRSYDEEKSFFLPFFHLVARLQKHAVLHATTNIDEIL
jgi:hypothetical protein